MSGERDCAFCGHPEAEHHPTRTETWCIVGIATRARCECPGYNPNGVQGVRAWLNGVRAAAWDEGWRQGTRGMSDPLRIAAGLPDPQGNPYRAE